MATKPIVRRTKPHKFNKLIKIIDDLTPELVEIMLGHARNKEDAKLSANAVEFLMDHYKNMIESKEKSDMQKLIINLKLGQGVQQRQQDNMPMIDFNTVQEV